MLKETNPKKENPKSRDSIKLKLKLKFKKSLPKAGVDLIGIAKRLSASKIAK